MRPTLFVIPHQWLGLPTFGIGWALIGLLLAIAIRLTWAVWRRRVHQTRASNQRPPPSVAEIISEQGLFWMVAAGVIVFGLPRAELTLPDGQPLGIAIRGYGLFLALAAIGSVAVAAWRAQRAGDRLIEHQPTRRDNSSTKKVSREGLSAESVLQLAPWTFLAGVAGARLFYVIQYFSDFRRETLGQTIAELAAVTQGGLVVYGGLIGGGLVSAWFIHRRNCSVWRLGDAIIPCVFIGLFFGRLGCLMNGCCFGGPCDPGLLAAEFPAGSPVYRRQLLDGRLIGLSGSSSAASRDQADQPFGQRTLQINQIRNDSVADELGLKVGERVELVLDTTESITDPLRPATNVLPGLAVIKDGRLVSSLSPAELPQRAMPVRATQVISAVAAAIMFCMMLGIERLLQHNSTTKSRHNQSRIQAWSNPGVLLCLGCIAYALLRTFLEWVRVDEAAQFGTGLSISQLVSLILIAASIVVLRFRLMATSDNR
ncbi:MAG: prolipoprotein diacylglyceryl transferase family protein [Planctomycetota bacterium]